MSLSARFFALYGALQLIGILGAVLQPALWSYVGLSIGFIGFTLWDRRTLGRSEDFALTAIAPRGPRLAEQVAIEAKLTLQSARAFAQREIRILAPEIDLFEFATRSAVFDPSQSVEGIISFSFSASVRKLGFVRLALWPVRVSSSLGLFNRVMELPLQPVEFRVSPERLPLREQAFLELIQTQRILNPGARLQVRARAADLFHSVRKYQFPDPIRHIDQKKSARFGELMTRVFEEQQNHHLVIALDTGRAMSGFVRGSRKSDYYLSAALALAENAIKSRDQVSLFAFSQKCHANIRRARNLASFQGLFKSASEFSLHDVESDYGWIPRLVSGSRAIVVVLTDLSKPSVQDSLLEALAPLCRKHLTVILSLSDRDYDLDGMVLAFDGAAPELKRVPEFKARYADLLYSYWLKERHILFRERFARLGGGSLVVNDADWISSVERLYLLLRHSRFA